MLKSVPEQLIDQIFAKLPATWEKRTGRRANAEHLAAPSVVAIPTGAALVDMAERPGARPYTDPFSGKTVKERPILMRRFAVEWRCHGAPDFVTAENVYLTTLIAARNVLHHEAQYSNEQWIDQQEGDDSFDKWGTVIAFTSTINLPVWDNPATLVTLNPSDPFNIGYSITETS